MLRIRDARQTNSSACICAVIQSCYFNVWDAGSAKAVAASGAKAIATSSWSIANANGFMDGERIPLDLAINILRRIVRAVDVPVTADLESGYGDAPEIVGGTIRLAIEAGLFGDDSFFKRL